MIVLDTHAWLWWTSHPDKLGPAAREEIDRSDQVGVATISAWEVAMLTARGKIELDRSVERWVAQALANPRVVALNLTAPTAVRAGLLDREQFPGDPADRIIYASALAWNARLATRDEALRGFDPRGTVWD
jgi:PIN domain nuclease of toxin-antitoxin system